MAEIGSNSVKRARTGEAHNDAGESTGHELAQEAAQEVAEEVETPRSTEDDDDVRWIQIRAHLQRTYEAPLCICKVVDKDELAALELDLAKEKVDLEREEREVNELRPVVAACKAKTEALNEVLVTKQQRVAHMKRKAEKWAEGVQNHKKVLQGEVDDCKVGYRVLHRM